MPSNHPAQTAVKVIGALIAIVVVLMVLLVLLISLGGNLLKSPVESLVHQRTGRTLNIGGNLGLRLGWDKLYVKADQVAFSNPPWAKQPQMLTADRVAFSLTLLPLLHRQVTMDEVQLDNAAVALEQNAEGRKNWLLDTEQKDEKSRVDLGRLILNRSRIDYTKDDEQTSIHALVSTEPVQGKAAPDITYRVSGRYKGVPINGQGGGGPALALRDERKPYPFKLSADIGRTSISAEGTITGMAEVSAVDLQLKARGDNMADLFPVLGVALPETPEYRTAGHLTHGRGRWSYDNFTFRIGNSRLAGDLQVNTIGPRPRLMGDLEIRELDFADLGPLIGTREGGPKPKEDATRNPNRVLPDIPFRTERWNTLDADLRISAKEIRRIKNLPITNLSTHVVMKDADLTLDPLKFDMAGGTLSGSLHMNGSAKPMQSKAKLTLRKFVLAKLLPAANVPQANLGRVDGLVDLSGKGNSIADMLGTADGRFGLVINGGQVSRLTMETVGLHLLEILALRIGGDEPINIRCGVGDFGIKRGVMKSQALVFDTEVNNVQGAGSLDFAHERIDLTIVPHTKETRLASLRSPIFLRGTFAHPQIQLDTGTLTAKGLAALGLGAVNPLLALVPLVEQGPGMNSDCGKLINETLQRPGEKVQGPTEEPR